MQQMKNHLKNQQQSNLPMIRTQDNQQIVNRSLRLTPYEQQHFNQIQVGWVGEVPLQVECQPSLVSSLFSLSMRLISCSILVL